MDKPKFVMQLPQNPYRKIRETNSVAESNPRPLPEVELVNESNKVLDRYKEIFKQRYGLDAIITNPGVANTLTKDIIRKVGLERALALIEHYMRLDGDNNWYVRNGHSLKTFQAKIEEINASLGLSKYSPNKAVKSSSINDPLIDFETQCPNCKGWHHIVCKCSEADKHAYTTWCKGCLM